MPWVEFEIGEWYRPDASWKDEVPTSDELADEDAYAAARARGDEPEYLPWQWRRAAAAGEALLRAILREFGPGVVVEIKAEHYPNVSPPMLLRSVGKRGSLPTAFLDFPDDPLADGEPDASMQCDGYEAVRVVGRPSRRRGIGV